LSANQAHTLINASSGSIGLQTRPVNFYDQYTTLDETAERRRQRVTVVNCSAANSYATETGSTDEDYEGAYVGDVVDVVDIFLLAPPDVTACNVDPGDDPQNNYLCANQDIGSVALDVEFVDSASSNSVAFDSRTFAILVH